MYIPKNHNDPVWVVYWTPDGCTCRSQRYSEAEALAPKGAGQCETFETRAEAIRVVRAENAERAS